MPSLDSFSTRSTLSVKGTAYEIFRLNQLEKGRRVSSLPHTMKIFLENLLRREDGRFVRAADIKAFLERRPPPSGEFYFMPARVLMQDFTGVPAIVDLAAMRDAIKRLGGDPARISPLIPVDLVVDHSVQVDRFGFIDALAFNSKMDFERNGERYGFLKWGQTAFEGLRVVPPETGICHQVNLEYLSKVVMSRREGEALLAFPDTLVGTDSHTTMVNGLGVLGWGVGGIEAEAAMLGQPMPLSLPEVLGLRLVGRLGPGATATDAVLTITETLRKKGVVGKFVEFCGPGLDSLSIADRATISNMCPEYGATAAFFPVDRRTLEYLVLTGRSPEEAVLVERYCKAQGLFREEDSPEPEFSEKIEVDLGAIEPCLAGPRRPQDRVPLKSAKASWGQALSGMLQQKDQSGRLPAPAGVRAAISIGGVPAEIGHGTVVIAAITSCTNTSNPAVMIGAGLVAKKAVEKGLRSKPWVKTSLAPGSMVVTDYLKDAGLMGPLEKLGFHLVGYGCTTCIGNSGPLPEPVAEAVAEHNLVVAAVLSGNRNFDGRIHPQVAASYLASPPLVVAYALAGRMDADLDREPLGTGKDGRPVFLKDLWPSPQEIQEAVKRHVATESFRRRYAAIYEGDENWSRLDVPRGETFAWDACSTYLKRPPYFDGLEAVQTRRERGDIRGARALAVFGDSITTDHISPAGTIPRNSPSGDYLVSLGVRQADFNSYGSRRGNHEVMARGTFANTRIKNLMLPGTQGGLTLLLPEGVQTTIFEASQKYRERGVPLLVFAGKEYGSGSSRDWAAKGPLLLGVRAVIAESFERIHRSNLVGMGLLPLQFESGRSVSSLGLSGLETFDISGLSGEMKPRQKAVVRAVREDGTATEFDVLVRLDSPVEVEYFLSGGILPYVLSSLFKSPALR